MFLFPTVVGDFFSYPIYRNRLSGSPSLLFNEQREEFSCGVKRPEREADQLFPSSAEFKSNYICALHRNTFNLYT